MPKPDLAHMDSVLTRYDAQGRTALLPVLHAVQDLYGYIPEEAARRISRSLGVPLADIHGVIEFYTLFYNEPIAETVIHVCGDPACSLAGADTLLKDMRKKVEIRLIDDLPVRNLQVERAACLGLCEHAPAVMVQRTAVPRADTHSYEDLVGVKARRPDTPIGGDVAILTAHCGQGKTNWLDDYLTVGGYHGLRSALSITPRQVVDEIKNAGLVGRGGAAFPTGLKWESAAAAPGSIKYVVCNADEAEPGTFKDRVMMEDMPHRVIEGLICTGYAIGAQKGYIYIRGEYTYAYDILDKAVQEAQDAGLIGQNILGTGFNFEIELRKGAGAYICGEETALFESIEGKRGFPRVKPPFPTTHGLFNCPTVINNVETLINVPIILTHGAAAYRKIGTEKSPGPKLFCLSGDVERPGLYEVPFGVTFRHLLEDLAGGIRSGRKMQAALFGGAAGAFANEQHLDVHLSFEDLRAAGLPLGSGVITVFDETRDLSDIVLRLAHFFAEESCGKCYPCQIGTQRQLEIIHRVAKGQPLPGDSQRLNDVITTMTDASLCGLGQTAGSAVQSAMRLWPQLFSAGKNAV